MGPGKEPVKYTENFSSKKVKFVTFKAHGKHEIS